MNQIPSRRPAKWTPKPPSTKFSLGAGRCISNRMDRCCDSDEVRTMAVLHRKLCQLAFPGLNKVLENIGLKRCQPLQAPLG